MDIRDIHEEPPVVENGRYLEEIYDLQWGLINEYVKIEGNMAPPVNVNTKKAQVLLKDFTGRVIEELAEGYESLLLIQELMKKNNDFHSANYSEDDFRQILNHLQNAGEEMADAMHFFTELLIYINIMPEDIGAYIDKKMEGRYSPEAFKENVIARAMIMDGARIQSEYPMPPAYNNINLLRLAQDVLPEDDARGDEDKILACGNIYNPERYAQYKGMLWDVTYHLNIAKNFLKNKPWKQSQMITDEEAYQEEVVKAFIAMMGAFYTMGLTDENLYYLYFKKNCINRFRQRSQY